MGDLTGLMSAAQSRMLPVTGATASDKGGAMQSKVVSMGHKR